MEDQLKCFPFDIPMRDMQVVGRHKSCLVCQFEGRYICRSAPFCHKHGLFLCTKTYQDAKEQRVFIKLQKEIDVSHIKHWDFLCCDTDWTCWDKGHKYYIPNGLFKADKNIDGITYYKFDTKSSLYLSRRDALSGIPNGYK